MPNYAFSRLDKPSITCDRFYRMREVPKIGEIITDEQGFKWKRIVPTEAPQASIDTKVDPYSAADFAKATNKRGTIGDLWDRSAEMSAKREDKEGEGKDPIKNQFYENYSKKRKGKKHPQQVREESTRKLKDKGIRLDWGSDD